jgi:hypothetical protein
MDLIHVDDFAPDALGTLAAQPALRSSAHVA